MMVRNNHLPVYNGGRVLSLRSETLPEQRREQGRDFLSRQITATSYIVAEHPEIFTIMGFTIQELPQEEKDKYFKKDTRKISRAEISREDFLNKFLKK